MPKKKIRKRKAKERRHAASKAAKRQAVPKPDTESARKPAKKRKKRHVSRWLGLTSRQWLWIGAAVAVVMSLGFWPGG